MIDKVCRYIRKISDKNIILLRNRCVIQWLFGDLSFLPKIKKKSVAYNKLKYKSNEDFWGRKILKKRRPDLKLDKQWTNKFGEHICEEIFALNSIKTTKPLIKNHYQPDAETNSAIIEVKTATYYTRGTASEKILGCPFKYAEVPELYSKPLQIMCIGGAEKLCREQYGNLDGKKCTLQKKRFLEFFRENKIEYIGATDMLCSIVKC